MKYRVMSEHRGTHGVEKMAEVLGVARSGYYCWTAGGPSARAVEEKELVEQIQVIQGEVSHRYGSPRMREELERRGRHVGKKRVARIMRENELGPRPKRRFVLTTRSEKGQEVAENLLDRNFAVPAANRVWVSDITYVATSEGWMYLCTVLDLYSRRVVGWALSCDLSAELVLAAVAMAVIRRRPPRGLMFHSDRGVQYTSGQFKEIVGGHGFIQSMSRRGDCWDNACAETFFKTLRAELIRGKIYRSKEEAREEIFKYVEVFYNRKRLHSYLGYLTPTEYEELEERKTA
jgi:transposase InsO family protein